jgi:hypothetical protein
MCVVMGRIRTATTDALVQQGMPPSASSYGYRHARRHARSPGDASTQTTVVRYPCNVGGSESYMNEIERKRIENTVASFIAKRRPPVQLRDQVDLGFRFDGRSVEIFEIRPRWTTPLRARKKLSRRLAT